METSTVSGSAYVKSIQGICKIAEMVIGIIAGCLIGINFEGSVVYYFELVVALSCICALLYLILKVGGKRTGKWQTEFFYNLIMVGLYIAVSSLAFVYGSGFDQIQAGAAMGIVASLVHLVDAINLYKIN